MFVLAQFSQYFFGITLFLLSLFLILLVLVQRGRGGGITGALGGPGGQSAFGTKTGDVFTRITVVTAIIWILFCVAGVWAMKEVDLDVGNDQAVEDIGSAGGMGSDIDAGMGADSDISDSDIGLDVGGTDEMSDSADVDAGVTESSDSSEDSTEADATEAGSAEDAPTEADSTEADSTEADSTEADATEDASAEAGSTEDDQ